MNYDWVKPWVLFQIKWGVDIPENEEYDQAFKSMDVDKMLTIFQALVQSPEFIKRNILKDDKFKRDYELLQVTYPVLHLIPYDIALKYKECVQNEVV